MACILTTPGLRSATAARWMVGALAALSAGLAHAQVESTTLEPPQPTPERRLEGAIGLNLSHGAAYQGSDQSGVSARPAFYVRYGRFTVSSGAGFISRRSDDVVRGFGLDLSRSETLRVNLSLRFDSGRNEQSAEALNGLGDIRKTVRLRASAGWVLDDGWRVGAAWTVDAFNRGGGNLVDLGFAREHRWSPDTVITWGGNVDIAGARYMQTYFGISDEQAARTAYPVYSPGGGVRDVTLFASLRTEITPRWAGQLGIGVTRLVGPAAGSPLTLQPTGWGFNGGLARRF